MSRWGDSSGDFVDLIRNEDNEYLVKACQQFEPEQNLDDGQPSIQGRIVPSLCNAHMHLDNDPSYPAEYFPWDLLMTDTSSGFSAE
jgi:hypothetical protein